MAIAFAFWEPALAAERCGRFPRIGGGGGEGLSLAACDDAATTLVLAEGVDGSPATATEEFAGDESSVLTAAEGEGPPPRPMSSSAWIMWW